jgi:hypothetical protein
MPTPAQSHGQSRRHHNRTEGHAPESDFARSVLEDCEQSHYCTEYSDQYRLLTPQQAAVHLVSREKCDWAIAARVSAPEDYASSI